ncbi:MAG TPA: PAS domain-containing sensor histidine kinase [Cytophagaceae bacterium]|nr:PAS domain-containing sensor histidine kinase [Cytophagaceae bacterium]
MRKDIFVFKHFKEYASFCLLRNFEELSSAYINAARELNIPYMELLSHLSENQVNIYFKERLRLFLQSAIEDNGLTEVYSIVHNWREGKLASNVNKYNIKPSDILLAFAARKNALLMHLPKFTDDINTALSIVEELNKFNLNLEDIIFQAYIEVQQESVHKKNKELQKTNVKLQKELFEKIDVEKGLRLEKEFSETLIDNSIDGIFAFDKEMKITAWNKTLEIQNGFMKKEIVGKNLFEIFPNYKGTEEGTAIEDVLTGRRMNFGNVPYKWKRGFYEMNIIPLLNGKNQITGGLIIIHDITERKLYEDKLMNREIQLKEAQEIAHLGSWEWKVKSHMINWSDELYNIFGYKREEVKVSQELLFKHIFPQELIKLTNIIQLAFQNHEPFESEIKIKRKDEEQRILLVKGRVQVFNKTVFQMMGIALDITERKVAEEELSRKNQALHEKNQKLQEAEQELININNELEKRVWERTEQLSKINKDLKREISEKQKAELALQQRNDELIKTNSDLDNFIYTASHDLKAPISNIEGLVGTLKVELNDSSSDEVKNIIDMVNQSIVRFKDTIQDLTEITKTQKNLQEDVTNIDLNSLLEEIKFSIKDIVKSSRAIINADFCQYPDIKFSKANLKSIVYNLVSNAIKYRDHDRIPEIHISCHRDGSYVMIKVQDNGLGIPENQKGKIFTMFKRLHDHVEGSGIGLYIVKRIIDNNGGRVEVDSIVGVGTTFRVYIKVE